MKPSPILQVLKFRHIRLTTKDVGKGYYKGNRTGSMGRHTKWGGYTIQWHKVRTYVVPDGLKQCKLTPFVPQSMEPTKHPYRSHVKGPQDTNLYIEQWKKMNGVD